MRLLAIREQISGSYSHSADVVKVESLQGDDTRSWMPPSAPLKSKGDNVPLPNERPESAYFLSVNRNKRAICVNFKEEKGLEIMHKLVKEADVLVENYIPGKANSGKTGLLLTLRIRETGRNGTWI